MTIGPIMMCDYYDSGIIQMKKWTGLHGWTRKNGPAVISYYENGNVKSECWYCDGIRTRLVGPANLLYNECGKIIDRCWWIDARQYTFKDWLSLCNLTNSEKVELKLKYG